MNNDEKELIANFFARVSGQQSGTAGSVPATLPPLDPEANRFIQENIQKYPESAYRITQMAVVQEAALAEAQNRIRHLQWELQQAQHYVQQQAAARVGSQPSGGGFFRTLFGGGAAASSASAPPSGWGGQPSAPPPQQRYAPPTQAAYPPGYQPGMFQRQGSGFLGSALSTAAGVAGGVMVGNALTSLFSHHSDPMAGAADNSFLGAADSGGFGGAASSDPFAGAGTFVDQNFDAGADNFDGGGFDDSGFDGGSWGDDSF
ncbi:DUF2076 domain-containing protein [Entomobacter blattae]|uniref:ABC transporter substrate-binding protein n=1 Tax=Entomobacter blattae TaxID=2762277 RepID=A0A7H1NUV9_9PROT|nr:DUF2076 domain-containing protein [Entomobacter blattae]QNT79569.1 hypothetical protein JGUZn3_23690 [Entomobacter blattae]